MQILNITAVEDIGKAEYVIVDDNCIFDGIKVKKITNGSHSTVLDNGFSNNELDT